MFKKLEEVEKRFDDLERKLQDPSISAGDIRTFSKEHADLRELVDAYRTYKRGHQDLEASKELLGDSDAEMRTFAKEEVSRIEAELESLTKRLNLLLLPKDPNDDKNVVLEIRAGAGGDEAGLFASEMYRMYERYAARFAAKEAGMKAIGTGMGTLTPTMPT